MGSDGSKQLTQAELDEIRDSTSFTGKEIRDWYDKFHEDFPDGVIKKEGFIEMYAKMFPRGDARAFAEHVFHAYDSDGNGEVDFQEFMTTLSVSSKGGVDDKLHWAFKMYDLNGDGQVSRFEATEIIHAIYRMRGISSKEKAAEVAEQVFIALDKDKSDCLSEKEFVAGAKSSKTIMELLSGAR